MGGDTRHGLSARALAVDTAFPRPEEFAFTAFWFERPARSGTLTVHASWIRRASPALRFQIAPGGTLVMDIDNSVSAQAIEPFGVRR